MDWSQPANIRSEFTDGALHFDGHAPLKGVTFQIGEDETVWLTFQPDGLLQSLMTLADPTFTVDDAEFPWQRVKTSFDGGATHIALCKLFRYLAGKYCSKFEVMDESGYWDDGVDAHFTARMEAFTLASQQLKEEIAALGTAGDMPEEERRKAVYRLLREFAQRFPNG